MMTDKTPDAPAVALLPCDFCGRQPLLNYTHFEAGAAHWWHVICDAPLSKRIRDASLCKGVSGPHKQTPGEAIAAWNTRPTAALPSEDDVERVARAIAIHTYATTSGTSDCNEWEDMRDSDRAIYRNAARAAIAAMAPEQIAGDAG